MSLLIFLALLFHQPVYHCTADLYVAEHPCASAQHGDACVVVRGRAICR